MMTDRWIRTAIAVWAIAAATAASLGAQSGSHAARDSATVVFVCEHGTVKSVLAIALFRQMAAARGLSLRAISRGTAPDTALPPFMRAGLKGDGLSLGAFTPTRFSAVDLSSAILVVSFDQPSVAGSVAGRVPVRAWDGLPSVTADYAIARDSMRARMRVLVDSLWLSRRPK
jgi:hypothetical protein